MRIEQLSKCLEPLQKLRVRLGTCKIDLSLSVILYYWSFQGDTSVVVLFVLFLGVFLCAVCALCILSYF